MCSAPDCCPGFAGCSPYGRGRGYALRSGRGERWGGGGGDLGQRGSDSDQYAALADSSLTGSETWVAALAPCSVLAWSSSRMTGISPVSSATVTASLSPRRRRRRRVTAGSPMVPFLASNSATEIGWAPFSSECGPVMICRLSIGLPLSDQLFDLQHRAPNSRRATFRRLHCQVCAR